MARFRVLRIRTGYDAKTTWTLRLRNRDSSRIGEFMKIPPQRTAISVCVMLASIAAVFMTGGGAAVGAPSRQVADGDWSAVQDALGRPGTMMPGDVFRIGMPRSDLRVTVNGVPV